MSKWIVFVLLACVSALSAADRQTAEPAEDLATAASSYGRPSHVGYGHVATYAYGGVQSGGYGGGNGGHGGGYGGGSSSGYSGHGGGYGSGSSNGYSGYGGGYGGGYSGYGGYGGHVDLAYGHVWGRSYGFTVPVYDYGGGDGGY